MDIKINNILEINSKELENMLEKIKILYFFIKKDIENNKWIKIPNRKLYLNKDIMACYPDFFDNYKTDIIDTAEDCENVRKKMREEEKFKAFGVNWDVQTYNECYNSFCNKWNPEEKNIFFKIFNGVHLLCVKDNALTSMYTNIGSGWVSKEAYLNPIYRLGKKEEYELFEKAEVPLRYNVESILFILLKENLVPQIIFEEENLYKDFRYLSEKIRKYINYIKNIKFENNTFSFEYHIEKIKNSILNNEEIINNLGNCQIKMSLEGDVLFTKIFETNEKTKEILNYTNGDTEERECFENIPNGKVIFYWNGGGREETFYENGVLNGSSQCFYKDGNIEKRNYVKGILHGKAEYIEANGKSTKYLYDNNERHNITKIDNLLNIDKIRVNLDRYDENILTDPLKGHWELFNNDEKEEIENEIGKKLYERDPRLDIKKGGIVGIDFGTKSTVVVFQDDKNKTLPMRISGNRLNKEIENTDYENPTVIEFRDIESFFKDYYQRKSRPITKWEDITVSHTASQNLINGNGEEFYSIVSELKQWAGSKKDKLLIKDKKGFEQILNSYLELKENDIDPIEIYAYYIGNYINNMRNGIYLEYFLSFPVTYEKSIREKILDSFERGIKKSLPETLINDENIMKKFKVKHGSNEPAAYAVCALQEYGFAPEDDENIYYGVFDFGGSTLDFDFGIFREAKDIRYDYELEHFGAGGDRYLGGENILKELAFETFKENIDSLRNKNITFNRPEWCDRFIGDETLVDKDGSSSLNTKLLMEKLRGLWEETENIEEPKIKLNLFDKSENMITGFELSINVENLKNIIHNKIEGGIKNFFIAMEKAFKNDEPEKIYILLAGNSSKHSLVKSIFENYIKEKNIEILPALGTEEGYRKLEERGINFNREDKTKPTGKTGVAYGLLKSTSDSCIKIINRDEDYNNEINFKYYVGIEKKRKLKLVLTPNTEYNDFKFFSYVKSEVFNIYYTTLPEALEENLSIEDVKRIRISLQEEYDSETQIFIKSIGADTIEYAITKKDINEKEFLETGKITLD